MVRAMIDLAVWPVLTVSDYLLFFITLLTLFSPPAAIAAFATITDRFPPDIQKKVAKRLARNYFVVMLFSLTIGEYLLMVLGISTPALMLTGGLAVFIAGMPMMVYGQKLQVVRNEDEFHAVPRAEWESVVSVPMTFPMAVGGGYHRHSHIHRQPDLGGAGLCRPHPGDCGHVPCGLPCDLGRQHPVSETGRQHRHLGQGFRNHHRGHSHPDLGGWALRPD
jgi:hypothetical protein